MPRRAHCQAASDPASPAPMMRTASVIARSGRAPGQTFEGVSLQAYGLPLIQKLAPELAIELDRGSVPVEHLPAHAKAILFARNRRDPGQQSFSNFLAAILLANVNIFEKDSGAALER